MTGHRELQRTLFRMQADAGFARAILNGEAAALATTGLAADDLALVTCVDPRALRADPGGKRRTQIAGNATSEYLLTLAAAALEPGGSSLLGTFLTSPEFHDAMRTNGRLPLAFGDFAVRHAAAQGLEPVTALASLERAMASLRREARSAPPRQLRAGEVQLARAAQVLALPAGTLAWSVALRTALDAGHEAPRGDLSPTATETILLFIGEELGPHRLADVRLELLEPPADELMLRAVHPLSCVERAAFARAHGAEPEDLEAFLAPFVAEGVFVAGSG